MPWVCNLFTHSGAIKYQKFLKQEIIEIEHMPVQRRYSSNCGIGAKFSTEEDIKALISYDIEKLYEINGKDEKLIYRDDRG